MFLVCVTHHRSITKDLGALELARIKTVPRGCAGDLKAAVAAVGLWPGCAGLASGDVASAFWSSVVCSHAGSHRHSQHCPHLQRRLQATRKMFNALMMGKQGRKLMCNDTEPEQLPVVNP